MCAENINYASSLRRPIAMNARSIPHLARNSIAAKFMRSIGQCYGPIKGSVREKVSQFRTVRVERVYRNYINSVCLLFETELTKK